MVVFPGKGTEMNTDIGIEYQVATVLREKRIDIPFDPEHRQCRTLYGMPVDVVFKADGKNSEAKLLQRKIFLDTRVHGRNEPETVERITARLLHEKAHLDFGPLETPLALTGVYFLYHAFDDPVKGIAISLASAIGYATVMREMGIEVYNQLRYGLSIFSAPSARKKGVI